MEDWTKGLITGLVIAFIIGILTGTFISENYYINRVEELGKSICEEEYGMDYESYFDKTLRCKPFKESYDGIQVEVPKGITME